MPQQIYTQAEVDGLLASVNEQVGALEGRVAALEDGGGTEPPVEPPIEPPIEPPVEPPTGATITVSPGQSIGAAIGRAQPGDTVFVKNGTYPQVVTTKVSSGAGISILGESRDGTVIQGIVSSKAQHLHWTNFTVSGRIPVLGIANMKAGVLMSGRETAYQSFTGCTFRVTSGPGTDSTPQMAIRWGAHHITLRDNTFDGGDARGGQGRCLLIYGVPDSGGGATTNEADHVYNVVIEGNSFAHASADNIFAHAMYNVMVRRNTFNDIQVNTDHNDHMQILRPWRDITVVENVFGGTCDQCFMINGKNEQLPLQATRLTFSNNRSIDTLQGNGPTIGGVSDSVFDGNDFSRHPAAMFGLVLWGGVAETGGQNAPAGSKMSQNKNCRITNNKFRNKYKNPPDQTANGVNGNVCTGNDITI